MQDCYPPVIQGVNRLAITWVLMIPLLYFVGGFWFEGFGSGYELGSYGPLAIAHTGRTMVKTFIVFAILCIPLLSSLSSIVRMCRNHVTFTFLTAWALISSIWSQVPIESLQWALCLVINVAFAFYLSQRFNPYTLMRILLIFGWFCLLMSIILALFFPEYGIYSVGGTGAWKGIYGHKNVCAIMTVVLSSVALFLPVAGLIPKILRTIYIGLSIFLVIMTQSVAGEGCMAFVLLYAFAVQHVWKFRLKDRIAVIALAAMAGLIVVVPLAANFRWLTYLVGKDPTLTGRTEIWQALMSFIMSHPFFGCGYMGFWRGLQGPSANILLKVGWAVGEAHNGFLNVWIELGAVGLALIMYTLFSAFKNALVHLRASESAPFHWYISIIAITVLKDLDAEEFMVPNDLIWMLYVVACVGLAESANRVRSGSLHV